MIPALIGAGVQAGMGLYGYYQDSKAKDAAAKQLENTQRKVAERDTFYSNKMNERYNSDLMKRNVVQDGDFSKAGPLYANMQSKMGRAGDIAKANAMDDATKRGLSGTGLGAQLASNIDSGLNNAVAGSMGQYANSLQADPNLINSAYGMNQGVTNELQQNTMDYNMIQPSLGGVMSGVGSGLDVVDAHNTKMDNQKFIEDIMAKYTEANTVASASAGSNSAVKSGSSVLAPGTNIIGQTGQNYSAGLTPDNFFPMNYTQNSMPVELYNAFGGK